LMKKKLY